MRAIAILSLAAGCDPQCEPTPATNEGGIHIRSIRVSELGGGCFEADLGYEIVATEASAGISFNVSFDWNHHIYHVSGLSSTTDTTAAGGVALGGKQFTFCSRRGKVDVAVLTLEMVASRQNLRGETYYAFPVITGIRGSRDFIRVRGAEAEGLLRSVNQGDSSPATIRRAFRAAAAHFKGGTAAWTAGVQSQLAQQFASMGTGPSAAAQSGHVGLMLKNGGQVSVAYDDATGSVTRITLNASYQVDAADYLSELQAELTRGELAAILGLSGRDRLVLRKDDGDDEGRLILFERWRGQTQVSPDTVGVSLRSLASRFASWAGKPGYYIETIDSSVRDLRGASCTGKSHPVLEQHKLSGEPYRDIIFRTAIARRDGRYRCVYEWWARKGHPLGNDTALYHRLVDAHDGEALFDGTVPHQWGGNSSRHAMRTTVAVPYSSSGGEPDRLTRLPYGRALAYVPLPGGADPQGGFIDADFFGGFRPEDAPTIGAQSHTLFRYVLAAKTDVEPDMTFVTSSEYDENLANWIRSYPNLSGVDDPSGWEIDWLLNGSRDWDASNGTFNINLTTQAYFWAQYARYIWGYHAGIEPWVPHIYTRGPGDRDVVFKARQVDHAMNAACGAEIHPGCLGCWNGASTIYFGTAKMGGEDCYNSNEFIYGVPHEFGHWVSNTWKGDLDNSGAALEGFSDYISLSLKAGWKLDDSFKTPYNYDGRNYPVYQAPLAGPKYRGNIFYASLFSDHGRGEGEQYENALPWTGMWFQYLLLAGNYWSDFVNILGLTEGADRIAATEISPHHFNLACSFTWEGRKACAHRIADAMYRRVARLAELDGIEPPGYHARPKVELQRALRQHDWHRGLDNADPRKRYHRVSMSPSHAFSLTPNHHGATTVDVKFDAEFPTKWVSFFVSGNVTYVVSAPATTGTRVALFRPIDGGGLEQVAENNGCNAQTGHRSDRPEIEISARNDALYCHGLSPLHGAITFKPTRSGWFYAAVASDAGGEGRGTIILQPSMQDPQLTARNDPGVEATNAFGIYSRYGQTIPLTHGDQLGDSLWKVHRRVGHFRNVFEQHPWRFTFQNLRRQDGYTEEDPLVARTLDATWNFRYEVVLRYPKDETLDVTLLHGAPPASNDISDIGHPTRLTAVDPSDLTLPDPTELFGDLMEKRVIVAAAKLRSLGLQNGHNVYVRVKWMGSGANRRNVQYAIAVVSQHTPPPGTPLTSRWEDDSTVKNPVMIRRFCGASDLLEKEHDYFSVTESLLPRDADFMKIVLEEGEHLNVTYRGEIPAALDISGPYAYQWPSSGPTVSQSDLAYAANPSHTVSVPGLSNMIDDWRPFLPFPDDWFCAGSGLCPASQYFAERGPLWSYHNPYDSNDLSWNEDNAVHLTMTAPYTGPYVVRVRGQANLNGYTRWDEDGVELGAGAPYTLNLNFGPLKNPERPHWDFLKFRPWTAAPSTMPLACGR